MSTSAPIRCLFLDIGGVLLTNGWDHHAVERASAHFELDLEELEYRHRLVFPTYEEGRLTLEEYLARVIFHQQRSFTREQFEQFMFAQSEPYLETINLVAQLRARYHLKTVVVSNEGRELNAYRIERFKLGQVVDAFVSSCFVHLRKPDLEIFRLALDLAQIPAEQVVFIENTPLFVQVAEGLGIRGILHTDARTTRAALANLGLILPEETSR